MAKVTGETAEDLKAVGGKDLREYFIPKGKLRIPKKDIHNVRIWDTID